MEKKYSHLTAAERGAIAALLNEQYTVTEIAAKLGRNKSSISREIVKRSIEGRYDASLAQYNRDQLQKYSVKKKKLNNSKVQKYVCERLAYGWSPEQIAGRLKRDQSPWYVCKETIYRFVYEDIWAKEEQLYEYLRLGRKKRKKQYGRSVHHSKIPNRVSIHERPNEVGQRTIYGHAESDSVMYAYKMAINTVNELMTGMVMFTKLEQKTGTLTAQAMMRVREQLHLQTYTVDNGMEFVNHETVGIPVFFADPYSSFQRGSNENTNMLLRGYLPKRANITELTQVELDDIAYELNSRPRKRLNFKTPLEVYYALIQKGDLSNDVALEHGM